MNKRIFSKGTKIFGFLFASLVLATIAANNTFAAPVSTTKLFTDSNDVRWEIERIVDTDNEAEPESVSIKFYDKPAAMTTIVVPSLNDVLAAIPEATQTLDTYYVKNADQAFQAATYTEPEQAKRLSSADVTVLDMTNTSKVQILGVQPIINPDVETELIFGENMVIGDGEGELKLTVSKRAFVEVCTAFDTYKPEGAHYNYTFCTETEPRVYENAETLIHSSSFPYDSELGRRLTWDELSTIKQREMKITVSDIGCQNIPTSGFMASNYHSEYCYVRRDKTITTETTESIDTGAFANYKLKLTNLENVKYLGWYAFQHTTLNEASRNITIKANQTAGEGVFAWSNVKSATFEGTETFPGMFKGCQDLSDIDFKNVETVSYDTFMDTNLGSIDFSDTHIKTILGQAFSNAGLDSINLDGVQSLGYEAFSYNNLTELYLPKSLEDFNSARTFAGNINLTKLTIAYDTMKMHEPLHGVLGEFYSDPYAMALLIEDLTLIAPYGENEEADPNRLSYDEILSSERLGSGYRWNRNNDMTYGKADEYKNVIAPGYFYGFTFIENLTIGEGYEFVGTNAFYQYSASISRTGYEGMMAPTMSIDYIETNLDRMTKLRNVSLPESLKGVGANSFAQHMRPDFTINLPEGLEYIGDFAFANDAFMKNNLDLPHLKYLGYLSFYVSGIRDIVLHDSLEYVGNTPFLDSWNIHDVTFDYDVLGVGDFFGIKDHSAGHWGVAFLENFNSTYGCGKFSTLYEETTHNAMHWGMCVKKAGTITFTEKAVTQPVIAGGVSNSPIPTGVGWFYQVAAHKIDLSKTPWKALSAGAFLGAVVDEVLLPENLEYIGYVAFGSTRIKEELVIPDSVKYIDNAAFNDWEYIQGGGQAGVYVEGNYGDFKYYNANGEEVEEPARYAYSHPVKITKLPANLEYVGAAAFYADSELRADLNSPNLKVIGSSAFVGTNLRDITIPESIITVRPGAFFGISELRNLTFDGDFWKATTTSSYPAPEYPFNADANGGYHYGPTIYGYFAKLDYNTWYRCGRDCGVQVDGQYNTSSSAVYGDIIFTEKAETAPYWQGVLANLVANKIDVSRTNWAQIQTGLFAYAIVDELLLPSMTSLTVVNGAPLWRTVVSGKISVGDGSTTLPAQLLMGATADELVLPDTIETIGTQAAMMMNIDKEVALPSALVEIQNEAFQWAHVNFSNTLSEGLTTIGLSAFYGAELTGDMTIPSTVTSVGWAAFNAGDADTHYGTVTIKAPLDYTKASNQAIFQMFWNASMDKLVIESPMLPVLGSTQGIMPGEVEAHTANGVETLQPQELRADGEPEFHGMTMREVEIKNLPTITANAFEECANLETVSFANHTNLEEIAQYAFNNDTKLKHFTFGDGLVNKDVALKEYAFNNTAVETIGNHNTDFDLTAANFNTVQEHVFSNMPKLKSVDIPNNFNIDENMANAEKNVNGAYITSFTFSDDPELENVTIGYQVAEIRDGAFLNDEKLTKLFIWGNTDIQESDDLIRDFNNTTIPHATNIFAYSDAPAENYAYDDSRSAYDGKFYPLDEVLYLTSNKTYVILEQDEEGNNVDFDKDGLILYALRRDGVILESDDWQTYTKAFTRASNPNIVFEEGKGAAGNLGTDEELMWTVYDAPKPFDTISLANQNYQETNFEFIQMPSSANPLVAIHYPDGYTAAIRTTTLASMTKEEEEEMLRELEVPNTGAFQAIATVAAPSVSIAAIIVLSGIYLARKRKN